MFTSMASSRSFAEAQSIPAARDCPIGTVQVVEDNRSRNVQLLKEYHAALQASDGEKMASMLAPDLRYWVSPGSAFSGNHDKPSLLALLPAIFDAQAGPTTLTYREITAQDDRVSLVADGKMPLKAGGSYDQTYHWLFKFRGDQIVEILEYLDILAVWKAFGTPEQVVMAKAATEGRN
jgi:ketosteroid isomerase-like protein